MNMHRSCHIRVHDTWATLVVVYCWATETLSVRNLNLLRVLSLLSKAFVGYILIMGMSTCCK